MELYSKQTMRFWFRGSVLKILVDPLSALPAATLMKYLSIGTVKSDDRG